MRRWSDWDQLRLNVRAVMRSTHDVAGGNEGADASHFIRVDESRIAVPLDLAGPGAVYFARHNHWHGSPWHYQVDGHEVIVRETSTASPNAPVQSSIWEPSAAFPFPLARTWSDTHGADLSWTPIAFSDRFMLGYERTHYGTGYFIAHRYPEGTPVGSWNADPVPSDVTALMGQDAESLAALIPDLATTTATISIGPNETQPLARLSGSLRVRELSFDAPEEQANNLESLWLQIRWDNRSEHSVFAPLPLFFGAGTLFNRANQEWLVRAFPVSIRFVAGRVRMTSVFPMPFREAAEIVLVSRGAAVTDLHFSVKTEPSSLQYGAAARIRNQGYFHASYVDHRDPARGHDLVLLDTRNIEAAPDWCGHVVGTSIIFSDSANLSTLEGDPRFFFDDAEHPQAQGTGTEEWGGGGDYWGGLNMTLPFAGHPVGTRSAQEAVNTRDKIESLYRFLLTDYFPFGKNARIQLEHGGENDSTEHYQTLTYWYGAPKACLARTDSLQLGDATSESAHAYASPAASIATQVSTRWDLGVDAVGSTSIQAATTDWERHTAGTSEFELAIDPLNVGVLLRRKFDSLYRDQRALVYVAPLNAGSEFKFAGTWYFAGGSSVVYSNPATELGATDAHVQAIDRRWREDELLIPRSLTVGRSKIRVRIAFAPLHVPIAPDVSLGPEAWSEVRYDAYSYLAP